MKREELLQEIQGVGDLEFEMEILKSENSPLYDYTPMTPFLSIFCC